MNIAMIDDHNLFVESLKIVLINKLNPQSINTYHSLPDYIEKKKVQIPDIIILDLMMPHTDGFKSLEYFKKEYGERSKIIILSFISNIQIIREAFRLGANAFVTKSESINELIEAIEETIKGNQYLTGNLRESIIGNLIVKEKTFLDLTEKEQIALQLVCKGFTLKEIAFEMDVSYHSAQYYYKSILKKFNLQKNADLIVFAMVNGLYKPDIS